MSAKDSKLATLSKTPAMEDEWWELHLCIEEGFRRVPKGRVRTWSVEPTREKVEAVLKHHPGYCDVAVIHVTTKQWNLKEFSPKSLKP